ncbi:MAG: ricin-type beta-trefoil lectin domain protein [Bacteroidota bacterium]
MKAIQLITSLKYLSCVLILTLFSWNSLLAQIATKEFKRQYEDMTIDKSTTAKYITLAAVGGDGGAIERVKTYEGGRGALVLATFEIGPDNQQIQPGGTIRFMVGGKGDGYNADDANMRGAGGGGGTGIAYKGPDANDKWKILIVAAGGSGATWAWGTGYNGKNGHEYSASKIGDGQSGYYNIIGQYTEEERRVFAGAGAFGNANGHPHAHAGWPDGPDSGEPTGGSGYDGGKSGYHSGGWGFGAGGIGDVLTSEAGGGGGYSGGSRKKGGRSYLNEEMNVVNYYTEKFGSTKRPKNGYATYELTSQSPVTIIKMAANTKKCLDNDHNGYSNGNNIQLWDCNTTSAQKWNFDGYFIRLADYSKRCVDVKDSQTTNGTNIRIWDCMAHNEQRWIYDGVTKQLRSSLNTSKCLNIANNGSTTNGTNVMLWDCITNGTKADQWLINGTTTVNTPSANQYILSKTNTDLVTAGTLTSNIQLIDKKDSGSNTISWVFNNNQILYSSNKDLCLGLKDNQVVTGTNIQLMGSASDIATRKWIYDGRTQQFRSLANPNKCIDLSILSTNPIAMNLQLNDCTKSDTQKFLITKID